MLATPSPSPLACSFGCVRLVRPVAGRPWGAGVKRPRARPASGFRGSVWPPDTLLKFFLACFCSRLLVFFTTARPQKNEYPKIANFFYNWRRARACAFFVYKRNQGGGGASQPTYFFPFPPPIVPPLPPNFCAPPSPNFLHIYSFFT